MRVEFLTLDEVLSLHADQVARYGGSALVRDVGLLESALAMPAASFGAELVHTSLEEQAAAYLFYLVKNHPFVDGNKRVGHAAMETYLVLNGWELAGAIDEQEQQTLRPATGILKRDEFTVWVESHLRQRPAELGPTAGPPGE